MNKKIAGLIIITVALVSIFIWEFWGRENLAYKEVLVMKDDTPASTVSKGYQLAYGNGNGPVCAGRDRTSQGVFYQFSI